MHNLVRIGKFFALFFIMIIVVDIAILGYTYIVSVNALEDTLSSVALLVAEENCLDYGTASGANVNTPEVGSKLDSVRKLMASNATAWLCYNNNGFFNPKPDEAYMFGRTSRSDKHTDIQTDDCRDVSTAAGNVDVTNCLVLSKSTGASTADASLFSYTTCPQRGTPIVITLKANINVHLLSIVPSFGNVSIPVQREITVIGMKFYKGKDGT